MKATTALTVQQLNENLHELLDEVDAKYDHFEEIEESDLSLDSLEHRFKDLALAAKSSKVRPTPETGVLLEALTTDLEKLCSTLKRHKRLLEDQMRQVDNKKVGFRAYIDTIFLE